MALLALEGVYRNGKVELPEHHSEMEGTKVIVTFLHEKSEEEAERRKEAAKRMLARMEQGINFGGEGINREEMYEERMNELDARRGR